MYVDVVNGVNINQQTLHWGHPLLQKIRDATCALTSSELRPDLQLTIWGWCISPIKWWFWRQFIIDVIGTWNSHMNQICHKEFPCLTDLRRIIPACSVPLFPYTLLWSDFIFAATAMSLLNHNCPLCLNHLLKRWNMMKSMCWIVLNCFDVGYDCHWLMGELWTLNILWWAPSSAVAWTVWVRFRRGSLSVLSKALGRGTRTRVFCRLSPCSRGINKI